LCIDTGADHQTGSTEAETLHLRTGQNMIARCLERLLRRPNKCSTIAQAGTDINMNILHHLKT
jgi:hypothetical protein